MQLILEQTFPLGRFHATPWKAFPYDDPHGEWPPSPWRLVRAVLARSYQLDREVADSTEAHAILRESMVRAFAASRVTWQLPLFSWRGPGLRQYHPAEFKRVPASAKEPGMMAYNTTKVLDSFWVTSNGTSAPMLWHFDGPDWTPPLLAHLDACLARMTYFGRAESITEIRRTEGAPSSDEQVSLSPYRSGNSVPVLALKPDATLAQLEATTDTPSVRDTNIPPGSRWMYAERPQRPRTSPAKRTMPEVLPTNLIQFAIGSTVLPRYKDTVRITERFRARVLACFTKLLTGNVKAKWADASPEVRHAAFLLSGKQHDGTAARGHQHASFFLCGEASAPSRLCVWRSGPFTSDEHRAILNAASYPLPLNYKIDPWTITLVPLDKLVSTPPGLDEKPSRIWKTVTPYVPPRHVHDHKGRVKGGCSINQQVADELAKRTSAIPTEINVEDAGWVKVHRKMSKDAGQTNSDKRGYLITLTFDQPITGPISIGSSSHFGLGLFVPA
jgi:CRISPR-associated protein Csb2